MVEVHSNLTVKGTTTRTDGVLPTQHAVHETLEITHGFTPCFETAAYLFSSVQPARGDEWVGDHLRPKVRVPESWDWPVGLALSTEIGYRQRSFSPPSAPKHRERPGLGPARAPSVEAAALRPGMALRRTATPPPASRRPTRWSACVKVTWARGGPAPPFLPRKVCLSPCRGRSFGARLSQSLSERENAKFARFRPANRGGRLGGSRRRPESIVPWHPCCSLFAVETCLRASARGDPC